MTTPATPETSFRLDPMAETFVWFQWQANVHSNQAAVVEGVLDPLRLRAAIDRAAADFPLLLARPDLKRRRLVPDAWSPGDVPLALLRFGGRMAFANKEFRRFLMDASARTPTPRWELGPPARFLLILGQERSCVLMGTSHAVADAVADSFLLEAVGRAYAEGPSGKPSEPAPLRVPESELSRFRHTPVNFAAGVLQACLEGVPIDAGLPRRLGEGLPRRTPEIGPLDFHHEILPDAFLRQLKDAAQASGRKLNAIFCGALARLLHRLAPWHLKRRKVRASVALGLRPEASPGDGPPFGNFAIPCPLRLDPRAPAPALALQAEEKVRRLREEKLPREVAKMASLLPFLRLGAPAPSEDWLVRRLLGTNVFFSNPGPMPHPFREFGPGGPAILDYAGLSTVLPPYSATLYTPLLDGRLHLNAVFRADRIDDFAARVAEPFKQELERFAEELIAASGKGSGSASALGAPKPALRGSSGERLDRELGGGRAPGYSPAPGKPG